ncbi:MAG: HAD-IA family hydrolase [Acidobacteria bacterium]|nr:HAD-IA family hydrolase [Acidobacteriota bacterium]
MRRFKAVFLDVGGTLLHTADLPPVYCEILAAHGYDVGVETMSQALAAAREAAWSAPAGALPDYTIVAEREFAWRDQMIHGLLTRLGVTRDLEACRQAIWESWLSTRVFHQYPETHSVLARLKRRAYVVAAISNWEPRLEKLCANHGIREYFDFILASEAEGHVKPSPFLFHKALRLAGVTAAEAIHVGDNYREDVEAARSLGMAAVLVARDGSNSQIYSPAIRSLEELFPLLEAEEWIQGTVISGVKAASGFTELSWVRRQLVTQLGFLPYPGTLNVRLASFADRAAFERLKSRQGILLQSEAGYCAARCFPVNVEGRISAAVIVPDVKDYPEDKLEILAPVRLRDTLRLSDGHSLTVAAPPSGQTLPA